VETARNPNSSGDTSSSPKDFVAFPDLQPTLLPVPKSHLLPLLIALLLVASGALYFYLRVTYPVLFTNLQSTLYDLRSNPPSPAVAPQSKGVSYTLPSGSQTYRFSHGKDVTGPKIQVVTFDPLDPALGSTQTITLEIESPTPLKSAQITQMEEVLPTSSPIPTVQKLTELSSGSTAQSRKNSLSDFSTGLSTQKKVTSN